MGAILDLIGSYIFKAAMIGIILATSISLNDLMTKKAQSTNLEKTMNVAMSVIEWDLRNMGYNYTGTPINYSAPPALRYYADIDDDGTADYVQWAVSKEWITIADSTVARYNFLRRLNSGSWYTVLRRVRELDTRLLNASGVETATLSDVRAIRVRVVMESPFIVNDSLLTSTRQITVFPPNLSLAESQAS